MKPGEFTHSSHWGAFIAQVERGRLVGVRPFPGDPAPTPLLQGIPDGLDSKVRVQRPSVRLGWLEQGPGRASKKRGAESFVEVSWETALQLVAGELIRVSRDHGNAAIFGGSYGWASAGRFHHAKSQLSRFLNGFGGCTEQIFNYSYAAASAILPHVIGTGAPTAGDVTSWDVIVANTKLWVMFGGAPAKNAQVGSGGVGHHLTPGWFTAAKAAGIDFVSVTPVRDDAPEFLGAKWLPVRPNTDTALMLGLAYTLLVEGLQDQKFIDRYCVGWEEFRKYILGISDGVPKTAVWAAQVTEIEAETIRELARRMASTRTLVTATWSLQRADHGEQPFWMTVVLAAMLGQIGLPGGGFGFGYGGAAGIGNRGYPFAAPNLSTGTNNAGTAIPVARIVDMLLHPNEEYDFNGRHFKYPDIRMIYWAGGNPFHHHQDINRLLKGWYRPETIVVHEPWWTATARHADIVLPATTTLERNDVGASSRDDVIVAMHQAVEPFGDARNDYDIFADLSEILKFRSNFTEGRDEMAWIRHLYDSSRSEATQYDISLPEFDTFWKQGFAEVPRSHSYVLFEKFRTDPQENPLGTPSGRIEIFSNAIAGFAYPDCPGHPTWMEPAEWLGGEAATRYPLHLISNQPKSRLHSQLDMGRISLESKVSGREPCRINPDDAAERGIISGDVIRVYNGRGSCLAGALLSDQLRRGVVQLSTGAWYEALEPGVPGSMDVHGNPNVLTADHGTSRLGQGPSAHSALVEVEKFEGPLPKVTVLTIPPLTQTNSPVVAQPSQLPDEEGHDS